MNESPQQAPQESNLQRAQALLKELRVAIRARTRSYQEADLAIRTNLARGKPRMHCKNKLMLTLGELALHREAELARRRCHHELQYLVPLARYMRKQLARRDQFTDSDTLTILAWWMARPPVDAQNLAGDLAVDLVKRYGELVRKYVRPGCFPQRSRLDLLEEPLVSRRRRALYEKLTQAVQLTPDEDSLLRGALQLTPNLRPE